MKKKITGLLLVAIFGLGTWGINNISNHNVFTDISLGNVEALASYESGCANGCLASYGFCTCNGDHFLKEKSW